MRTCLLVAMCLSGCVTGNSAPPSTAPDAAPAADATIERTCPTGHEEKLRFTIGTACQNDGSVEFCISDGDAALQARVTAISSTIVFSTNGGRAGCHSPGQFLSTYKTAFPGQCDAQHGAATKETWADLCAIAALPEVAQIVPTFFE